MSAKHIACAKPAGFGRFENVMIRACHLHILRHSGRAPSQLLELGENSGHVSWLRGRGLRDGDWHPFGHCSLRPT